MLKKGIRHGELSKVLALLGEGDAVAVCGCRQALPEGVPVIDLALTDNIPTVDQVLDVLASSLSIKEHTIAQELDESVRMRWNDRLGEAKGSILAARQLSILSKNAKVVVRTGDMAQYGLLVIRG